MHLWRPKTLGDVVAERRCDLVRDDKIVGKLTLRLGRPVRGPAATAADPWWCPFEVRVGRTPVFRVVAGQDSFQALILALELCSTVVPDEASRRGARAQWLDDSERVVLAREALSKGAENAIAALLGRIRHAAAILGDGPSPPTVPPTRASRALEQLNGQASSAKPRSIARRPRTKTSKP